MYVRTYVYLYVRVCVTYVCLCVCNVRVSAHYGQNKKSVFAKKNEDYICSRFYEPVLI